MPITDAQHRHAAEELSTANRMLTSDNIIAVSAAIIVDVRDGHSSVTVTLPRGILLAHKISMLAGLIQTLGADINTLMRAGE